MHLKKILVLCTGNSCRSQIAEGYLRKFSNGRAEIYSAGIEAHGVNPKAIRVMKDDGIDISDQTSNSIAEYRQLYFDFVITVCDNANELCPVYSGDTVRLHQNFPDPAKASGSGKEVMQQFADVRNMIKDYCKSFVSDYLSE